MEPPYVHACPPLPAANQALAPIVSPRFCGPYPVDLVILRKVAEVTDGNLVVTERNGDLLFKVKTNPALGLHDKRILLDASGSPVLTLRHKIISMHNRWQAFNGESTEVDDLLFTVKRCSMIRFRAELDVFLAANKEERACDFKVKGSWFERSCVVYAGETDNIVAQMHRNHSIESTSMGKDKILVTVYPNMDSAFIAALIVILDDINKESFGCGSVDVDFSG